MLKINAPYYVRVGQMYQDYMYGARSIASSPNAVPNQEQFNNLLQVLRDLENQCTIGHLVVAASVLKRTIQQFEQSVPKFQEAQQALASWFSCLLRSSKARRFCWFSPIVLRTCQEGQPANLY